MPAGGKIPVTALEGTCIAMLVEASGDGDAQGVAIALSQAMSLKRIADALTGQGENMFNAPLNDYGENIGRCIQGQFERSGR